MISPIAYAVGPALTFAAAFAGAVSFGVAKPEQWFRYQDERLGARALVPSWLHPGQRAPVGEGRAFYSDRDEAQVVVAGLRLDEPLERRAAREADRLRSEGAEIDRSESGEGWYAISGRVDGAIFHLREKQAQSCDGAPIVASLGVRYDEKSRAAYDALITPMAQSLSGC